MEISMQDGRVMASIKHITFPLTVVPISEWRAGEDVIDHRSLRAWEADCMQYITDED